ncbi:hypothetical protein QQG91_09130 [Marivivens sp. LCG002]|uniref:DUF7507 domain-containing protein n=1 Tax=Marivivens sp. LCG002 TaxID=3051171 RepID=UPI0025537FF0|nr:hypothetical protein [Marivivens sp. LCG002]WIV49835.1 hypothetical protein QQG91_09130 [Marivivens sp. LCG002]
MKFLRRLAACALIAVTPIASHAEELIVPFADGLFGDDDGNNTIDALNVQTFASFGLATSFFSQVSGTNIYEDDSANTTDPTTCVGGNDVPGRLRIRAGGYVTEIAGCLDGKYKEGGKTVAFNFNPTASGALSYKDSSGNTQTVSPTSGFSSLNIVVIMNGYTAASLTPVNSSDANSNRQLDAGEDVSGDSSGVLTDLNNYLALAKTNSPSGPITADSKFYVTTSTDYTTNGVVLTGSATLQSGETISIVFNNQVYTTSNGLTVSAASGAVTWSLNVGQVPAGTYDVNAWIVNSGNWILQDATTNELIVSATAQTVPLITLSKTLPATTDLDNGAAVGDNLTYTITARNIGTVDALTYSISDKLFVSTSSTSVARTGTLTANACTGGTAGNATLEAGETCSWTYSYTLVADDLNYTAIGNIAELAYTDASSNAYVLQSTTSGVTSSGTATTGITTTPVAGSTITNTTSVYPGALTSRSIVVAAPAVKVTKIIDTTTVVAGKTRIDSNRIVDMDGNGGLSKGDRVYYTITAENSSNSILTSVSLADTLKNKAGTTLAFPAGGTPTKIADTGLVSNDTTMAIGDIWTYSAYYEVTEIDILSGGIENIATITATGGGTTFSVESSSSGNTTSGTGNGSVTALTLVPAVLDLDGDGKNDLLESNTADRDGDGIPDASDYDPEGYFYCQEDGRILSGGAISVTGPNGTNSALGNRNGINIVKDGSDGQYQWFVTQPGTYTMELTYPKSGIPSTTHKSSGTVTLASLAALGNPASIGHSEYGSTGYMSNFKDSDATNDAPTAYYTTFIVAANDPYLIGNNIPMQNCSAEKLVEDVKERITDTLVEDFRRTVDMQQASISQVSRGALLRLQEGYEDLPCGDVDELDVSGNADIKNGEGTIDGTISADFNNCVTGERRLTEGDFTIKSTRGIGVETMLNLRRQWERLVSEDEVRGKFLGGYFSNSAIDDGKGLTGSVTGFGLNAGLYGAFTNDNEIFVDYYAAAALGVHTFTLGFASDLGDVDTNGNYIYGALFGGAAVSGTKDMGDYKLTPRLGFDVALARANNVTFDAERLNLTAKGELVIPAYNAAKVYAEAIFSFGDEEAAKEKLKDYWTFDIAPRAFCELTSRSTTASCGWGIYFDATSYRVEEETDLGLRLDYSGSSTGRALSISVREEQTILDGNGTLTHSVGSGEGGSVTVGSQLEVKF